MKRCPGCNKAGVVQRRNKRTGTDFLGCLGFPRCTWTYSRRTPTGVFDRRYDKDPGLDEVLRRLPDLEAAQCMCSATEEKSR